MYKNCILITACLFILSCQTQPKKSYNVQDLNSALLSGFISIKDLKKNKSYLVNFKTKLLKYSHLRLDVTAPFFGHLASLSVVKDNLQYVIPPKKKYYSGPVSSRHLKNILPFELDAQVLFNVFWGTSITQPGWKCKEQGGLPELCVLAAEKIKVMWERQNGVPTKIFLRHPLAKVDFLINKFTPTLTEKELNQFIINKPEYGKAQ